MNKQPINLQKEYFTSFPKKLFKWVITVTHDKDSLEKFGTVAEANESISINNSWLVIIGVYVENLNTAWTCSVSIYGNKQKYLMSGIECYSSFIARGLNRTDERAYSNPHIELWLHAVITLNHFINFFFKPGNANNKFKELIIKS